jgi:ligand-binding sensor domain-containing protein
MAMKRKLFLLTALLCTSVLFLGSRHAGSTNAALDQTHSAGDDTLIWTKWGAHHYALADDGDSIWLGAASGLIRWNKAAATYTRYGTADDLPHRDVLAAAVDGLGNRWFGGDGGLSRLDTAEKWTHYNTANSGIHSDTVDGIAAAADGTVWLSHIDEPHVSQRSPEATWLV